MFSCYGRLCMVKQKQNNAVQLVRVILRYRSLVSVSYG